MRWIVLLFTAWLCSPVANAAGFGDLFEGEAGLTVIIRDASQQVDYIHNCRGVAKSYVVYSTFKVPNTIIALETGVAASPEAEFKFDPQRQRNGFRKDAAYNRDQTLESAFKASVVWTYQEIAKSVGRERYGEYLRLFNYGNRDISGDIRRFWLDRLAISPIGQVEFLEKIYTNELGLKGSTVQAVKSMMLLDSGKGYRLYGKTGTGRPKGGKWQGWLVGFVGSGAKVYYYAIHAQADTYPELKSWRMEVLREGFRFLGVEIGGD